MTSQNPSSGRKQPIDPLLAQRLDELGSRRAGAPLPPPNPGQQPARSASAKQGAAKQPQQQARQPQQAPRQPQQAAAKARPATGNPRTAAARAVIDTTPDPRTPRTPPSRPAAGGSRPGLPPRSGQTAPRPGKRVKPARSAKLAALALSVTSTAGLAIAFANNNSKPSFSVTLTGGTVGGTPTAAAQGSGPTVAPAKNTTKTTKKTNTTTPTTVAKSNTIKDGTYTGQPSDNRWGTVQVAAVYQGGQLVNVNVLQYPSDHNRSVEINQYALPILIQDSISSQSANVQNISGATYSSQSYIQSLQSAIDAAKQASGVTG